MLINTLLDIKIEVVMKKFVEIDGKDIEYKIENAWYQQCDKKQVPFIKINSRTKFADVHWDYITYNPELDNLISETADKFTQAATEIFNRHANHKSSYKLNGSLVWFYDLEIPKARLAASELYDLVASCLESKNT